ncbi:hypothetical protein FOTG_19047 [Fusarium oxysporum f. sp. vasinfectum 25433]|uniref:CCHC-type domain-containing protein n=1 Tax=Fusarium oxysporum f. sp. vasinfectum 25433 TaxID=1089449 RepID=X0KUI5_FUSOX|nr:hypothetical protein FOTG_19047 [Fusarium oxysporum f. sp. vasinfectum 25433]
MVDPIGAEIVVEQDDAPFSTPKRPSRMVRPTSKVRDTARQLEDTAIETRRNTRLATRNVPAEEQIDRPTETRKSSGSGSGSSDGRAMLQKALDLLAESRRETKRLQEALKEQMEMTRELKEAVTKQEQTVHEMGKQMVEIKDQMTEELQRVREQLETIVTNAMDGPQRSYADVTRLTPFLPHNDSRNLAAPPNPTDVLYCTIDVSRLGEDETRLSAGTIRATVENEIRSELDNPTWRCRAVTKDPKNPHRIRITCRDESEHEIVKRIAETKLAPGARILRDDLYPIRVDNVSRIAVLDERNEVRAEITEMLGRENDTEVAKIAWLSKRDIPKAYGSMVVYLKKRSEARRFISEGFFVAGGESGTTKVFERRDRPKQCYNCQQITNHKAYQCDRSQVCGKCAREGHHHSRCAETILRCIPCGGPHESFSRNCQKLYPSHHE